MGINTALQRVRLFAELSSAQYAAAVRGEAQAPHIPLQGQVEGIVIHVCEKQQFRLSPFPGAQIILRVNETQKPDEEPRQYGSDNVKGLRAFWYPHPDRSMRDIQPGDAVRLAVDGIVSCMTPRLRPVHIVRSLILHAPTGSERTREEKMIDSYHAARAQINMNREARPFTL